MKLWRLHKLPILYALLSVLFYVVFAYDLERSDLVKLFSLYTALFVFFYKILQAAKVDFKLLLGFAILLRLVFLAATPNLSQDFYRFIWDGRVLVAGYNPYLYLPKELIATGTAPIADAQELFNGMGSLSSRNYTNYPPINQLCFAIAGLLAGKSVVGATVILRILIIAADIGTILIGKKLLEKLNIPVDRIFWYALNPFIIIELTGNLHFEGVMIFFLILGLYLLHNKKWIWAGIAIAASISVKLIPLILLPVFFQFFTQQKVLDTLKNPFSKKHLIPNPSPQGEGSFLKRLTSLVGFYLIILMTIIALFIPFFSSEFISNYQQTIRLWFSNFEFNASLYYIAREIGYAFRGYNEIKIIGKYIPPIIIAIVLLITFVRNNISMKNLITGMLLALSCYFFISTTVHPWYVATLLILSVFTKYRFPLVWSFVVIFSYTAYANDNFKENLWFVGAEYIIVYGFFIWEVFFKTTRKIETTAFSNY
ncbi:mannosyltransferase [Spongiivirga citrea]|uniref:Mannosyltransferase n=1 Tax=Spongiivirga citrea TaxID=1481457 RepID=A0A6M0CJY8_9FLAO|nr:mannosyltransferase [Spongiivirga citrea]NER18171.1 mannosyltransferase [Spongiivirga citrea]